MFRPIERQAIINRMGFYTRHRRIMNGQDALDKLNAGATLVQVYSVFIYKGPQLLE